MIVVTRLTNLLYLDSAIKHSLEEICLHLSLRMSSKLPQFDNWVVSRRMMFETDVC